MNYQKNPQTIEQDSMAIIEAEAGDKLARFNELEKVIVKRVIHTTADFEYADLIEFHPNAVKVGLSLLKDGQKIYADTSMIKHGINCKHKRLGIEIVNYVHDPDVYELALKQGITRSMAAMQKAAKDSIQLYTIGNAPTAIFQLKALVEAGHAKPALIIGVPVGFVGAAESKALLSDLDIPYIRINGRKGGSPVAAAIINAMMKLIDSEGTTRDS